jgi:hypothetical protein
MCAMHLANEVKGFCDACERLLALIAMNRQLTEDEARVIDHYSKELQAKVAPRLPKSRT